MRGKAHRVDLCGILVSHLFRNRSILSRTGLASQGFALKGRK